MAVTPFHHALLHSVAGPAMVEAIITDLRLSGAVSVMRAEAWGITNTRSLTSEAYRTDEAGRQRHLVLVAQTITLEAQNALLKLLEEPPQGVIFHCLFPPGLALLPTVRSRLFSVSPQTQKVETEFYDSLVRLPLVEQFAEIDERLKKKDVVWVAGVRSGALARLRENLIHFGPAASERLFNTLLRLNLRGASNKMLLEELVLTVACRAKTR